MASYEFHCEQCDKDYTFKLPMSAEKPTVCEVCGSELRRIWSAINIHYTDSGFTKYGGRNGAGEAIVSRRS